MIQTTLNKLKAVGIEYKGEADNPDTPILLLDILNHNGLKDALLALETCDGAKKFDLLLACDYAEHVLYAYEDENPDDDRVRNCIEVSRRYANGDATKEELEIARRVARAALAAQDTWTTLAAKAARVAWATLASWAGGYTELKWQKQRLRELLEDDGYVSNLPTSNLPESEREILEEMRREAEAGIEPAWGMSSRIARRIHKNVDNMSLFMGRLCESGHIIKIRRGVYRVKD